MDTPPAKGGIEILGTAALADVVCGAGLMQRKFQQSKVHQFH